MAGSRKGTKSQEEITRQKLVQPDNGIGAEEETGSPDSINKKDQDQIHTGHREKLRNRFILENGFEHFEDHQILELLLFYANSRKDTNPIAHELLDTFGSLKGVEIGQIDIASSENPAVM